jgi:hypothetical protein
MPLISCPACSRQISVHAEACPQCGHPNRPIESYPVKQIGPRCYRCSSAATTRCQSCGALSCVQHVNSIHVMHGRGGYELRCERCYSFAMAWKVVGFIIFLIVGSIILLAFSGAFR